jgi:hypothetical protein
LGGEPRSNVSSLGLPRIRGRNRVPLLNTPHIN